MGTRAASSLKLELNVNLQSIFASIRQFAETLQLVNRHSGANGALKISVKKPYVTLKRAEAVSVTAEPPSFLTQRRLLADLSPASASASPLFG